MRKEEGRKEISENEEMKGNYTKRERERQQAELNDVLEVLVVTFLYYDMAPEVRKSGARVDVHC